MFILRKVKELLLSSNIKTKSAISFMAFMPLFAVTFSPNIPTKADKDLGSFIKIPVAVIDGEKVVTSEHGSGSSEEILSRMGIRLDEGDFIKSDMTIPSVEPGNTRRIVTIDRVPKVTITVDGQTKTIKTRLDKVADVLAAEKISLNSQDIIHPTIGTDIQDGQEITITRIKEVKKTVMINVPHKVIIRNDYNLYQGQTKTIEPGSNGLIRKQYNLRYKGGKLVKKVLVENKVLKTSKDAVLVKGVKPYSNGDLWKLMVQASEKYGVDPGKMYRVMMCESGGNVNSVSGAGYKGLFQWDGTYYHWTQVAGVSTDYFNPRSQIFATAARVQTTGWGAWPVCGYR